MGPVRFQEEKIGDTPCLRRPDAVEPLRAVRRAQDEPEVAISVADPLNLVGIISPGAKVPACAGCRSP